MTNVASQGGTILFVGTKRQAQDAIREEADRLGISVADMVRRIVDRYRGEREEREQRDRAQKDKRDHDRGGRP